MLGTGEKTLRKTPLGRSRSRCDDIKMTFTEIGLVGVNRISLPRDVDKHWTLVTFGYHKEHGT